MRYENFYGKQILPNALQELLRKNLNNSGSCLSIKYLLKIYSLLIAFALVFDQQACRIYIALYFSAGTTGVSFQNGILSRAGHTDQNAYEDLNNLSFFIIHAANRETRGTVSTTPILDDIP